MTNQAKKILKQGMEWSIEKQSKVFNNNFITRYLYNAALKRSRETSI
ncbi:MAG: hypothetical protein ACD_4C00185G0009 [uncultured bacterium (gcode 4)]|uniref:Uncharacterized protein n=1 Tax=uncultured bacterium (gcode 4) TaxID=1234023 RepID=K2F6L0_9BACT|nr:MAG: hypothetical protein ACD_4C00185G0009 [uncultured bacterium (gcode 4)]